MATATLDPSLVGDDIQVDSITQDELNLVRRIRERAKAHQHTPYRKALLERVRKIKQGQDVGPPSELPGGGYMTYQIISGKHSHIDKAALEKSRDDYRRKVAEAQKLGMKIPDPFSPQPVEFHPKGNDTIVPQDDLEALMIDQDPIKFRPLTGSTTQPTTMPDELMAEVERLKAALAQKDVELVEARKKGGK